MNIYVCMVQVVGARNPTHTKERVEWVQILKAPAVSALATVWRSSLHLHFCIRMVRTLELLDAIKADKSLRSHLTN